MKVKMELNKKHKQMLLNMKKDYQGLYKVFSDSAKCKLNDLIAITEKNDIVELYSYVLVQLNRYIEMAEQKDFLDADCEQANKTIERGNKAQLLAAKVSSFMTNSIARKSRLLDYSQKLVDFMKNSDNIVSNSLAGLERTKQELNTKASDLDGDSNGLFRSIQECEIINNISKKCDETSDLYKAVLGTYEKQTESLQGLYNSIPQ
jgi:hypothetical protein